MDIIWIFPYDSIATGVTPMPTPVINFADKFTQFSDLWSPKIVAQMNDYHFKLVKIKGEFIWHDHPETDEVFIVIQGRMVIHLRNGSVELNEGEMYVVPKGVEHKPSAEEECQIMLIEPIGTVNTGDAGGEMTAESDVWI
jgi:mannose-6-phosphate isomerase-like protein (cupin superfamily)